MADAVARGFHLRKVDAEIAARGTDRGEARTCGSAAPSSLSWSATCACRSTRTALGPSRSRPPRLRLRLGRDAATGISFAMPGRRLDRAVSERTLVLAVLDRLSGAVGAFGLDHREHRADRHLVADFARELDHLAGDRAFHLDRRLVGHHVGDLLVLADRVADLDVPGDDFGLGNAFADVGQLEFVSSHQSAITFSRARFMRFGPGK